MGCVKCSGIGCFVCCLRKMQQVRNDSIYCILRIELRRSEPVLNETVQKCVKISKIKIYQLLFEEKRTQKECEILLRMLNEFLNLGDNGDCYGTQN